MDLTQLGFDLDMANYFQGFVIDQWRPARVVSQQRDGYFVQYEDGIIPARLSGRFRYNTLRLRDLPAVGDWVAVKTVDDGLFAMIHAVAPRKSAFVRKLPISGGRKIKNGMIDGGQTEEDVIAANVDTVFVVVSLEGCPNLRRIERYLTLVLNSGARPVVVLNKLDLCPDLSVALQQIQQVSGKAPVIPISAIRQKGVESLSTYLIPGQTVALLGSSGAGKSTIINWLLGEKRQKTQAVSLATGKGRHTTTNVELISHSSGYLVIDTPGLRELQLWGDEEILALSFEDISSLVAQCRYSDCRHQEEPGCAVRRALNDGSLDPERWESYLKQHGELQRLGEKRHQFEKQQSRRQKRSGRS